MTAAAAPQSAPLSLPSRFWADLSTRDFAALQHSGQADQVVAVLPVAAVEQHRLDLSGRRVAFVVSGQNLSDKTFAEACHLAGERPYAHL